MYGIQLYYSILLYFPFSASVVLFSVQVRHHDFICIAVLAYADRDKYASAGLRRRKNEADAYASTPKKRLRSRRRSSDFHARISPW